MVVDFFSSDFGGDMNKLVDIAFLLIAVVFSAFIVTVSLVFLRLAGFI